MKGERKDNYCKKSDFPFAVNLYPCDFSKWGKIKQKSVQKVV